MSAGPRLNIALLQMTSGPDLDINIASARTLINGLPPGAQQLVVLPEMWPLLVSDKYLDRKRDVATHHAARLIGLMSEWAARGKFHLVGGSLFVPADGDKLYNRTHVFGPDGSLLGRYDKIHLFDLPNTASGFGMESAGVVPGQRALMLDICGWRCGFSICYDLRFPALFERYALAGAEVLLLPSAFTRTTGEAHWETLTRARAVENQCYMLAVNQAGEHSEGMACYGNTLAVDPWGRLMGRLGGVEAGVLKVELDRQHLQKIRARLPVLRHRRNFELDPT